MAERLFDVSGHSEMIAWVISATGTSSAILGASLLVPLALRTAVSPLLALGRLALTFYILQAALVRWTPDPQITGIGQEYLTGIAIYVGFAVFAVLWSQWISVGPFEALLRADRFLWPDTRRARL